MTSAIRTSRRSKPLKPLERASRRAERQLGTVSRKQLLADGLSASAIQRQVAAGLLIPEHSGVYRWRGSSRTESQRAMAAVLAIEGSVLSHSSAAAAWDLSGFGLEPLHVTCVRHSRCRDPRITLHCTRTIDSVDVTTRGGLPVTTVHRTLLDLAGHLDRDRLAGVVDEAVLRRKTTLRWIRQTVDRLGGSGRSGTRLLREILDERSDDSVPNSELERRFVALVKRGGLPRPERTILPPAPRWSPQAIRLCLSRSPNCNRNGRIYIPSRQGRVATRPRRREPAF
jgi:hypothetical protein